MRKLVVTVSAVALVALGASVAQAQGTQRCPAPETLKFEQPFQVGQTLGGITLTGASGDNSVTFRIGDQVTIDRICVKAGTLAPVFENFSGVSQTIGGITVSWTCPIVNGNIVGDGTCTVTITRTSGPGISHVTFYTTAYVAPSAAVAPLAEAQAEAPAAAAPALAFTGAQISIMLAILVALIAAGTLAWTAGRRRAAKAE
jgi:hypothetical protein